jgi:hypothetical protein
LQYGKNTLKLYFKHGRLARGDEITDFGMNIQPVLILAAIALFVFGLVPPLMPLWIGSGLILMFILFYFVYSATKIAFKFRDWSAFRLVVLYAVRATAWFVGATKTTINYMLGKGRRAYA